MKATAAALQHVSGLTGAKVRIFLAEVAEGVSNYRSMHSLTQQVEHQYHGRFLIELIQNAHDAFDEPRSGRANRVEIVFDPDDSTHGSLLVANDGQPFTESNFERLSQLGQSDKDPQKSIGNKGIGFRSVLEISDCPEVYSRASGGSGAAFDGYCFAFRPSVVRSLIEPITQLATGTDVPLWSVTQRPIVEDWSAEMLAKLRQRVHRNGVEWLAGEVGYLSPYLLPVPIGGVGSACVADFQARGFSTVVRLPLKSVELRDYVLRHMEQLDAATVLFLDKISSLRISFAGKLDKTFTRSFALLDSGLEGNRVTVGDGNATPRKYGLWTRELNVHEAPAEFRQAIAALPGRWPEIEHIAVSVAVRLGDTPEPGRFSIYLPTLVATGSAAHVNAPFFGDMSRTSIPFDDSYNRQLLETAADLAVDVARSRLAGRGSSEAQALVDLIAPLDASDAGQKWLDLMDASALRAGVSLTDEDLIRAEDGWSALGMVSFVPSKAKATVLTADVLRRHATFEVFHQCLDSRAPQLRAWAAGKFASGADPTVSDIAGTVAAVAKEFHEQGKVDWNAFWRDVMALLPQGQAELAKHKVLLGADGALHSANGQTKVFFVPRQGTQDDTDISGESGATDVPTALRSSVAFLSDDIQLYETGRTVTQTPVRAYLGRDGLVAQFRVETIFSDVLLALTPKLPVAIDGPEHTLCRDILVWALRLIGNLVARGRGSDATFRLLRTVPVPCDGGWFPMNEASFGPGWPGSAGEVLARYLNGLKSDTGKAARQRLLLAPGDAAWGGAAQGAMSLLSAGGVFDGLRLDEIKPTTWASRVRAAGGERRLPSPPTSLSGEFWSEFVAAVKGQIKPPFITQQTYEAESVHVFPGMAAYAKLPEELRVALCELILTSLPEWRPGLEDWSFVKREGQWGRFSVTSPLRHFLQSAAWLVVREDRRMTWAVPAQRWFVPPDVLAGRLRQFAPLRPIPLDMARTVIQRPALGEVLRSLGLRFFDPHATSSSPTLLLALTAAVGSDEVSDTNVLLGQLRDAWQWFRPVAGQAALQQLAVRQRDRRLVVVTPTAEAPAYVPDSEAYASELEAFDFPVVAIRASDAKELKPWFTAAYGARVEFTSSLSLVPVVEGAEWTGVTARALADSDLGWMARPLLVLAAQGRGVHSAAFKDRIDTLASMRVDWAPSLEVALKRGDTQLATANVNALWVAQRKTLVASERCRAQPEELSGALAQALEREDLEWQLRFALRDVRSIDEPPDSLEQFLAPLRVSPEQIHEVSEHLKGDVGHMARYVAVLVAVVAPGADTTKLQDATNEEDLAAVLEGFGLVALDTTNVLQAARDSQDLFEFGRVVSRGLGPQASLSRWNDVLHGIGQPQLCNRSWGVQLQASIEAAAAMVKRVVAHVIRREPTKGYVQLMGQYQGLVGAVDLSRSHWSVEFDDAMRVVEALAITWDPGATVLLAFQEARTVDDLRARLLSAGVDMSHDPDECGRMNHELVERVLRELEQLRMAAWVKEAPSDQSAAWVSFVDQYRQAASGALSGAAFTMPWREEDVFAMIKGAATHALLPFRAALESATDLSALRLALGLAGEDLATAETRLEAIKAERARRRNVVKVCGQDFDGSEDNLDQLWKFLTEQIADENLDGNLDLAKPTALDPVNPRRRVRADTTTKPTKKIVRPSKAIEELTGLAGEIHVFRMLTLKYGEECVPASAWVSANSLRVFPFNQVDDGRGCDFAFTVKGRQFRVEVKASMGDEDGFTLGSSEIRLAMELGSKGKRRREDFVLVHVKKALSDKPVAIVLPNPYDPKHAGIFSIDEADARVRYRLR